MESYFFVPGTRLHKIPDIQKINVSEIIIDVEDAVKFSERNEILHTLKSIDDYRDFYIRIPLYNEAENLNISFFQELYDVGFRKFVFPKIQKASDFDFIISRVADNELKIILLVESSRFFLEVKNILLQYQNLFTGIGLGSHDFMAEVGGEHQLKNLEYARIQILYLARMINIKAIDIASMELNSQNHFKEEVIDGFDKGYDAKFFIHPWQINIFKSIYLYSEEDLIWAKKVIEELKKVKDATEFNPIIIEGQIIERPHLAKAHKIIKYYESK